MPKPKVIFLAVCVSYFFAVLYLAGGELIRNYWSNRGVILPSGLNLGGDFPIFYVAGKLYQTQLPFLYDYSVQLRELRTLFAGTSYQESLTLFFIYPPIIAWLHSLLAHYEPWQAFLFWSAGSLALFLFCTCLILSQFVAEKWIKAFIFLYGISFIPFLFNCIGGGQTSAIGLLIFSLVLYCRLKGKDFLEGIVLGLAFYKPPLFIFFCLLVLLEKRWKTVLGGLLSGGVLIVWSGFLVGFDQLVKYFQLAVNYRYGAEQINGIYLPPDRGVGLLAFLSQNIENRTIVFSLFAVLIALFLAAALLNKKRAEKLGTEGILLAFSLESSLSYFLSVQCINYDLTLLLPAAYCVIYLLIGRSQKLTDYLLAGSLILLHTEWIFRTMRGPHEYSPLVPLIVFAWILSILSFTETQAESRVR